MDNWYRRSPQSRPGEGRAGEDRWNTRNPELVAGGYAADSWWRNRSTFNVGREQIVEFR
jgi:nuclear transport factor 2 (NTF2) superfamily protein